MTQTPRDWQKDMEMCEAATPGPWIPVLEDLEEREYYPPTYLPTQINSGEERIVDCDGINLETKHCIPNAQLMAEARIALPYWLKEAQVYKQSYECTLTAYEAEKARADAAEASLEALKVISDAETRRADRWRLAVKELNDSLTAAEAREQRLKKMLEKIDDETRDEWIGVMIKDLLSTLYPDTPAEPVNRGTEKWDTPRPIDDWHEDIGPVLWWTFPIEEPPYCGSPLDVDWPGYHTHWTPIIIPFTPAHKEGK